MGKEKTGKIRVVLDTNVLVSALLFSGPLNRIIPLLEAHRIGLLISKEVFLEYLHVLSYPKSGLDTQDIKGILEDYVLPFSEKVEATPIRRIVRADPEDDKFLALAEAGRAEYLITGDKHLLDLQTFGGSKIITARELLNKF